MRILLIASLLMLVGGCTHSPRRVDCDGRLEAINPVTPAAKHKPHDTGREP
jgi:hypothetical protein